MNELEHLRLLRNHLSLLIEAVDDLRGASDAEDTEAWNEASTNLELTCDAARSDLHGPMIEPPF